MIEKQFEINQFPVNLGVINNWLILITFKCIKQFELLVNLFWIYILVI